MVRWRVGVKGGWGGRRGRERGWRAEEEEGGRVERGMTARLWSGISRRRLVVRRMFTVKGLLLGDDVEVLEGLLIRRYR